MYVDQIKDGYKNVDGYQRQAYGYTGWSVDTAKTNLWDQYTKGPMNSNPEKESSFMEVHISFSSRGHPPSIYHVERLAMSLAICFNFCSFETTIDNS